MFFTPEIPSVWLVISILRVQSARQKCSVFFTPQMNNMPGSNSPVLPPTFTWKSNRNGFIMRRRLHPVDSGHILSPISTCWSPDPPTVPIISPVTQLCSLEISCNGCARINKNCKLVRTNFKLIEKKENYWWMEIKSSFIGSGFGSDWNSCTQTEWCIKFNNF